MIQTPSQHLFLAACLPVHDQVAFSLLTKMTEIEAAYDCVDLWKLSKQQIDISLPCFI
jgi:hypothetical protein